MPILDNSRNKRITDRALELAQPAMDWAKEKFTPPKDIQGIIDFLRSKVQGKRDQDEQGVASLDQTDPLSRYGGMMAKGPGAASQGITNFALDTIGDASTPGGAGLNMVEPAKLAHLAGLGVGAGATVAFKKGSKVFRGTPEASETLRGKLLHFADEPEWAEKFTRGSARGGLPPEGIKQGPIMSAELDVNSAIDVSKRRLISGSVEHADLDHLAANLPDQDDANEIRSIATNWRRNGRNPDVAFDSQNQMSMLLERIMRNDPESYKKAGFDGLRYMDGANDKPAWAVTDPQQVVNSLTSERGVGAKLPPMGPRTATQVATTKPTSTLSPAEHSELMGMRKFLDEGVDLEQLTPEWDLRYDDLTARLQGKKPAPSSDQLEGFAEMTEADRATMGQGGPWTGVNKRFEIHSNETGLEVVDTISGKTLGHFDNPDEAEAFLAQIQPAGFGPAGALQLSPPRITDVATKPKRKAP